MKWISSSIRNDEEDWQRIEKDSARIDKGPGKTRERGEEIGKWMAS